MSVFNIIKNRDHTTSLAFLDADGPVGIQRYETLKYKQFDKLTDKHHYNIGIKEDFLAPRRS